MTERNAYIKSQFQGPVHVLSRNIRILIVLLLVLPFPVAATAQDEPQYDEFPVYIRIPYIGIKEIDAIIKDEEAYLPVRDLFDFLKIRNIPSEDMEEISGFFINPDDTYIIDRANNRIVYGKRTYQLGGDDLIRTESNLYLRSDFYGKVFGLECNFNFRDLTVTIETGLELPAVREMRQEEMRSNIIKLGGDHLVDTTIGRSYPGFRFGMADWSVYSSEQLDGRSEGRFNIALGSVIAGGEASASLTMYTGMPFSEKQQFYLWRHVNNDRVWMRQIMVGKINTQAISSVFNPVIGIQVTNTPTTFRRSFGTYTLTDRTEPEWTVELYVNNVLVDYVKADASGFFKFEVPLVYGNTWVKLKFYGPWGEERTREQNISIPYNFLPKREFEYSVSAGVVEDSLWSRFSRASIRYGATKYITVGGGMEYLSSITDRPFMPYVNTSVRVTGNLLLSGEYTHGVRAVGTMTYRLPSNIQLDLDYTKYSKNQKAISYNYLEEIKASVSLPVRLKKIGAYSRLSYHLIRFPGSDYSMAEWLVAGSVARVSANLTTYGIFSDYFDPNLYSNLSLGFRLPASFVVLPQVQFSYSEHELLSGKLAIEKRFMDRGYLNISLEHTFRNNLTLGEIGLRYDFSFAQVGVSARQSNESTTLIQYARGSLIRDRKTSFTKADNRTNVGRGGISILAFLDLNANGVRDEGEQKVAGLNIRSNSGRIEQNDKDTIIHIIGLEPYVKHFIEFDESNFSNISWRLHKKSYAVIADANMFKQIEVPVSVEGEATGHVLTDTEGEKAGIRRIIINFYDTERVLKARTLTEEDGYYSYFGLAPGSYYVRVDTAQLRKIKMTSSPDSLSFSIMKGTDGDYIEGLDFVLKKTAELPDTAKAVVTTESVRKDTSYLVVHEVTRELVTITEDYYAVQFGAFRNKAYAEIMKKKVESVLDKNVELFEEDGFWKVRITGFASREELNSYIPVIHGQGITEIWVITNKAVKSGWLTKTREDSLAVVRETAGREPVSITGTTIQLGAFSSQAETESMTDRLLAAADKLVTVRQEGGVFKVQITGFADTSEVRKFIPLLREHGFTDISVLSQAETGLAPVPPRQVLPVPEVQPAQPVVPEEIKVEVPAVTEEAAPPPPVPRFVLNAGTYYRRSQAERARSRIERKLNLPVEIVEEWDRYRVIVTGFFTREETYPYYPELAGLGFTDIFVYEKPLTDR
jgi:cell division protein FtsN